MLPLVAVHDALTILDGDDGILERVERKLGRAGIGDLRPLAFRKEALAFQPELVVILAIFEGHGHAPPAILAPLHGDRVALVPLTEQNNLLVIRREERELDTFF